MSALPYLSFEQEAIMNNPEKRNNKVLVFIIVDFKWFIFCMV
jgi:hypothetical protein